MVPLEIRLGALSRVANEVPQPPTKRRRGLLQQRVADQLTTNTEHKRRYWHKIYNKSYAILSVPRANPKQDLPEPEERMKAGRYVAQTQDSPGTWITRSLRRQYGFSTKYAARSETADTTDTTDSTVQQHCRTTQRESMPKRDIKQKKKKGRNW